MRVERWLERVLVALAFLLVVGTVFHIYSTKSAEAGAARTEARIAKAQADSLRTVNLQLKRQQFVLEGALVTATRETRAADARFNAAATGYEAARDTLVITDTAAVRATLAMATEAVARARAAQAKAEEERRAALLLGTVKDSRIAALEAENAAIRRQVSAVQRQVPGKLSKVMTALKWGATGYALNEVVGLLQ